MGLTELGLNEALVLSLEAGKESPVKTWEQASGQDLKHMSRHKFSFV